jgi:sulfoxide reductase heme-binding subunit YedZ
MSGVRPEDHVWWLASRASGLVALALMSAAVLVGIAMATGLLSRPGLKAALAKLHEQLSVASLIGIGLHGATLLGDPWLNPGLAGISVPFAIDYRPAFVATGIAGGYLAAALGLSYYARRRIGSTRWRNAHRFVIVAWVLSVVHTLGAGTDATLPAIRWALAASIAAIAAMLALRIALRPRRAGAAAPARRPEPAGIPRTGAAASAVDAR